ncbi:glycosyl-transferase for dystroglycan-domain-containing protein [Zychaea mexicana]|uniref:glycosyl-transferase for dystroglycan-domain-containing protein n=1 Tax=Zychaea mexicana TaxID=64656 RepID=UPI0022FF0575|nr:glycosyl-transferase for dystroglycan-domain-containing protein [Zychaea mexicana]KAI9494613.1 glycosyl-transferase for dystroglycan-domain-containing protein [Zychaea mexicana]
MAPSKSIKYLLFIYVAGSLFYATFHVLQLSQNSPPVPRHVRPGGRIAPRSAQDEPMFQQQQHVLATTTTTAATHRGRQQQQPTLNDLTMSKVFYSSMGSQKNVHPYFFKSKATHSNDDITIATLVTPNRFHVLSRLATNYGGPISAAIHISNTDDGQDALTELYQLMENSPDMQQHVDVHLIIDDYDRQFNMWRNVAKLFAQTEYVMMLDVDFHVCTKFPSSLRLLAPDLKQKLDSGRAALVVPAFEYLDQQDGEDWRHFPSRKDQLMQQPIDMFHRSWTRGHGSTNYTKWYQATEPYKVVDYNYSYEPYVIIKKQGTPWCDERFIGYGANKAACLYEIYLSGIEYWVLPNDFIIHQTHHYPEQTRNKERWYNRKLYTNFREELCLRYARKMMADGEWETARADNLKVECAKIKGFATTIQRIGEVE